MTRPSADASASDQERRDAWTAEKEAFQARQDAVTEEIKVLMAEEDPAAGVHHAEAIFELRQEKLRLDVEIQLREKRIKRLDLGYDPEGDPEPSGGQGRGFAF